MSAPQHVTDISRPRSSVAKPELLISTSFPVLSLFGVTFVVGIGLVLWLMRLRVGVYEFEDLPIFFSLFVLLDYWPAILGLVVVALGLLRPVQFAAMILVEGIGLRPYLTAAVTLVFLALGAYYAYQAHPLSMDEYSPYFQSQAFASGHLAGRFPPALLDWLVPPGFQNAFLVVSHKTGQVASIYMPGFALLLTPFMALGVPWLLNPVLGSLSVIVLHRLAMELFSDARLAGLSMLLAIASSAFAVNAMSYYSMTAHALANGLFVLLLLQPTVRRCLLAGLIGSIALVLHNPLPHALFALPWLVWLAMRPDRLRTVPAIAAGYLPLFLLLGAGWTRFSANLQGTAVATGAVDASVIERWAIGLANFLAAPSADLLFVRGIGLAKLWIWSVPVLLVAAVAGVWAGRSDHRIRLLAISCVTTLVGFLFVVFSQGHGWGFRYFHSAWLCLPLLAVAAMRLPAMDQPSRPHTAYSYVSAVALLALLTTLPVQVWQVHEFIDRHLAQMPVSTEGTHRLVIVNPVTGYYAVDLIQNDPFLRDPVWRMVSHGARADRAMIERHFPDLSNLSKGYRGEIWGTRDSE